MSFLRLVPHLSIIKTKLLIHFYIRPYSIFSKPKEIYSLKIDFDQIGWKLQKWWVLIGSLGQLVVIIGCFVNLVISRPRNIKLPTLSSVTELNQMPWNRAIWYKQNSSHLWIYDYCFKIWRWHIWPYYYKMAMWWNACKSFMTYPATSNE